MKNQADLNKVTGIKTRQAAMEKIKAILREQEKEEESLREFENKKEDVANTLRNTLNLVADHPAKRFNCISKTIQEWVECSKIEMEMIQNSVNELNQSSNLDKIKKQGFKEKTHIYRESVISMLFFNDKHLKSLYYLILTLFLWLLLWVIINDLNTSGQLINTKFWIETFKGLDVIFMYWLMIFAYSYLIVPYVKLIERTAKTYGRIHYYLYFTVYFTFQVLMFVIVYARVFNDGFYLPCKFAIACEVTRFSLKTHGYFREKILYGLKEYHMEYAMWVPSRRNNNEEKVEPTLPEIKIYSLEREMKMFLYYLFCPSMIYRDSYPRIIRFRWKLVFSHLANFIFCILFFYILMRYIWEPYVNFSKIKDYYSLPHFIFDTLRFAIPGVTFLVVGFFLLLHSWLNLWSELIRHGDRRFYEDWWNCTNFEEYYRKWNMVVHEWLYYYVYNDTLRLSLGRHNRFHAKMIVFYLSVLVHEMIIWIALGFFYPILSLFFGGPGIIFTFIKPTKKEFNIVFWCKLFLGKGLILVLYLREFKVRSIINEIGLVEPWHDWIPRTILMYFPTYKNLIQQSRFYY